MKKALLFIVAAWCLYFAKGHGGTWVWVNGSDSTFSPGNYGTMGIAADSVCPPGLYQAALFTDRQGNLWIFGGIYKDNASYGLNDLWKYNRATNMWTWVNGGTPAYGTRGIPGPNNRPAGRGWGCATWVDTSGNFWLFGGLSGLDDKNDLWEYNVSTNEWAYMAGDTAGDAAGSYGSIQQSSTSNRPCARHECNTA